MEKRKFAILLFILFSLSLYGAQSRCKDNGYLEFKKDTNLTQKILSEIIKKNPKDMECTLKLIHIYLKSAEVEKGFELLVKANSIDPKFIKHKKIHKILSIALYITDLKRKAIKDNDTKSWNILGATYYKMGVFNESIKAYENSLKIDPYQVVPRVTLALDFSRSDQAYRAIEELDKVIEYDKDNFFAYYYAGKILKYQIKDIDKAKKYLSKAKMLCEHERAELGEKLYKAYLKDLENETK